MRDVSRHWIDSKRPRAVAQVHVVRRISPVGIVGTVFRRKHDCKKGNGGVRVPEEQTSVFYDVEKTVEASKRAKRDGEETTTVAARAERGDVRVEKEDHKEERT